MILIQNLSNINDFDLNLSKINNFDAKSIKKMNDFDSKHRATALETIAHVHCNIESVAFTQYGSDCIDLSIYMFTVILIILIE